jgi:hypothetical protein
VIGSKFAGCISGGVWDTVAEKYDIQGLKDVVRLMFSTRLKRTSTEKQLLSIIEEVYTSTQEKDRGLRDPLLT